MNYEEMSDFQINKRVASKLGLAPLTYPHDADMRSVGVRHSDTWYEWFDYCNNPSDAWPIIFSSRIMLNPYCADELWKAEVPCGFDGFVKTYATCYHRNPLRAAMIVFLMMQDQAK